MKKRSSFKAVRNLLFFFFLAVFIISAVILAADLAKRQRGNRIYDEAKESFSLTVNGKDAEYTLNVIGKLEADSGSDTAESLGNKNNSTDTNTDRPEAHEKEYNETLEKVRAAINSLRRINNDVWGWIRIEGTSIDYPIVKGEDNERYLNHAYNGDFSPLGSIFADFRCSDKISDNFNTVLYGHNLLTGGADMFHDIEMFFDQDFFDSAEIIVYTYDGIYFYEPFSVYEARYDYNYYKTDFAVGEEFTDFAKAIKANSRCESVVSFEEGDRILTLSTCTNIQFFTRYALHAKLINAIEE